MMRMAKREDIPQVISVWQESFGDSVKEIEEFLDDLKNIVRICIWEEEEQVAAQLLLIPVKLCLHKKQENAVNTGEVVDFSAEYIYAVATKKCFRKRGICTKLLQAVKNLLKEEKKAGILVPAELRLEHFYEKRGFTTCFLEEKSLVTNLSDTFVGTHMTEVSNGEEEPFFEELDEKSYIKVRQKALSGIAHVDFPKQVLFYALKIHRNLGEKCVKVTYNQKNYGVLCRRTGACDDKLQISEITCATKKEAEAVAKYMLMKLHCKTATLRHSYKTYGIYLPQGFCNEGIFNLVLD